MPCRRCGVTYKSPRRSSYPKSRFAPSQAWVYNRRTKSLPLCQGTLYHGACAYELRAG
jgi:hypothetical protein